MISLSVYGDPADARYAAVWVKRQGAAWVAVHGVDSAGYQSFFNNWTAKGFVPVLVSATGASGNAIFAAVFEQRIHGAWFARHGMTSGPETHAGTFQNLNKAARDQKMILRSAAIYGTGTLACSDRRGDLNVPPPALPRSARHPTIQARSPQLCPPKTPEQEPRTVLAIISAIRRAMKERISKNVAGLGERAWPHRPPPVMGLFGRGHRAAEINLCADPGRVEAALFGLKLSVPVSGDFRPPASVRDWRIIQARPFGRWY